MAENISSQRVDIAHTVPGDSDQPVSVSTASDSATG